MLTKKNIPFIRKHLKSGVEIVREPQSALNKKTFKTSDGKMVGNVGCNERNDVCIVARVPVSNGSEFHTEVVAVEAYFIPRHYKDCAVMLMMRCNEMEGKPTFHGIEAWEPEYKGFLSDGEE